MKAANAYQRRTFDAEFCMNLHVGDGEKINFKKPPKLMRSGNPHPATIRIEK
jgi:hypothetical protein